MGVWVGLVNKSATGRWQWLRGPVVKTVPPTQGTKVQSLVRKLRFHTLLGTAYTHIYTYTYIYMLMCVCVCIYIYYIYIKERKKNATNWFIFYHNLYQRASLVAELVKNIPAMQETLV